MHKSPLPKLKSKSSLSSKPTTKTTRKRQLQQPSSLSTTSLSSTPTSTTSIITTAKRHVSKHKRFAQTVESIRYTVPKSRIKQSKSHTVTDFRDEFGQQAEFPEPYSFQEARNRINDRKVKLVETYAAHLAAGGEPRKFSLRKQYLYNRNRTTIDKAAAVLVIQPGSDAEFYDILAKLDGHWTTAHFRNGLVHVHDKPYAKLKEFFKGPIRVLLQNDPAKVLTSYKRLVKVLGDHPNTFFLGGAIDGFAGVAKDFEVLKTIDSKLHAQQQIIHTLSSVNALIPAVEYPTKNLAQLLNHHQKELEKSGV